MMAMWHCLTLRSKANKLRAPLLLHCNKSSNTWWARLAQPPNNSGAQQFRLRRQLSHKISIIKQNPVHQFFIRQTINGEIEKHANEKDTKRCEWERHIEMRLDRESPDTSSPETAGIWTGATVIGWGFSSAQASVGMGEAERLGRGSGLLIRT